MLFKRKKPPAVIHPVGGLPPMPEEILIARPVRKIDWTRIFYLLLGIAAFLIVYFGLSFEDAVDPKGDRVILTREGRGALGIFLLAGIWWVFEVIPIGITAIAIGVLQVLFVVRDPKVAFTDFMDPSVWFIFASVVIGMAFSRTGLTKRMAYRMLLLVGERTSMIYLGSFIMIAVLTLIMAHTAVAAAVFPLMMAIHSLYDEDGKPTKFGKGLFIGMAYICGAGSIVTLLGSARAAVAIGFFRDMTGTEISFFQLTYYLLPLGWGMILLLWGYFMIFFKPEQATIPGLKERVHSLYQRLGPISRTEIATMIIVLLAISALSLRSFVPFLQPFDKSAIILVTTVLFFVFKILTVKELEEIPWNIVLLFGGAMSIGLCLWQTGCAQWMAIRWLSMLQSAPWYAFVLGVAFFVLIMTNFIMNVAAIAISMPVALVISKYLGVAPEVVFYASLVTAGMPFLLLVGAAPNAIAYESKQFTAGQFFMAGVPASILLMGVLTLFVLVVWPLMGMPVQIAR